METQKDEKEKSGDPRVRNRTKRDEDSIPRNVDDLNKIMMNMLVLHGFVLESAIVLDPVLGPPLLFHEAQRIAIAVHRLMLV